MDSNSVRSYNTTCYSNPLEGSGQSDPQFDHLIKNSRYTVNVHSFKVMVRACIIYDTYTLGHVRTYSTAKLFVNVCLQPKLLMAICLQSFQRILDQDRTFIPDSTGFGGSKLLAAIFCLFLINNFTSQWMWERESTAEFTIKI